MRLVPLLLLALAAVLAGCSSGGGTTTVREPAAERQTAPAPSEQIPKIVRRVEPSVVAVFVGQGQGSGVIYDSEGRIVTNAHVVGNSPTVEVRLASGQRLQAEVLATDTFTDLAVLRVDRAGLPHAEFADGLPEVGALAIALGNPLGFENSVTAGIVSGIGRSIPSGGQTPALVDLIQTDAPISPGNSGGALVGADGRVIGVNVAFIPPQAQAVSLGFAIPAPTVVSVVEQLIEDGRAEHAYLGVALVPVTPQLAQAFGLAVDHGVLVDQTPEGGPAARGGVRPGDVIVAMGDREIRAPEDLLVELREHRSGDTVEVTVVRDGDRTTLDVELGERPQRP